MSVIQEIKEKLDIVDVVSQYLSLKKSGRSFRALCPFHSEKTPSFFVFPERQSWHCFGACGTGGDVFSFVMKREGVEFGEALRLLAQRSGVALPPGRQEREKRGERLFQANEAAASYFHNLLTMHSSGGEALHYLERRGIKMDTSLNFWLGYSPNSWDGLLRHLTKEGYKEEEMTEAGLVVRGERGGYHDLFRNRLMFPIRDVKGRGVGFGARALDEATPKYINSPQTEIFDKGSILYSIDRAKTAIRRENLVIVVEGYMDVLMAHQEGFENVVASMGTALTERQVSILRGLATRFALALDSDAAGDEATLRSLESSWHIFDKKVLSSERGMELYERAGAPFLKVISLPRGKDPDEVILEGRGEWQRFVAEAKPLLDYVFEAKIGRLDLDAPGAKRAAAEELFPLLSGLEDPFEQDRYIRKLAHLLDVEEGTLKASLSQLRKSGQNRSKKTKTPSASLLGAERDPLEEYFLALLLHNPKLKLACSNISADHFHSVENREVFQAFMEAKANEGIREGLYEALWEHLEALMSRGLPPMDEREREQALAYCIRRLEERRLRALMREVELVLSQGEHQAEELKHLQSTAVELAQRLRLVMLS